MWLVRVLGYMKNVQAESLTETAKLDLALVPQAEVEHSAGNLLHEHGRYIVYEHAQAVKTHLVDCLQPRIGLQRFKSSPVALP